MLYVLITLAAANVLLTPLAFWFVFRRQRQDAEDVRFALVYLTKALRSLNDSTEHALDCLVRADAALDAENSSETEANVA